MIKKILVANRGEIAMRIFRTCRVMNISTVAVYTHVDRGSFARPLCRRSLLYLRITRRYFLSEAGTYIVHCQKTGAAIHPGYGFLSENADFARRCEEEGVIFIGPVPTL